jgi:solute carrier family 25 (mitochondrial carnitine/acylcarnitine transporter), member 20/29
LAYGLTTPIVGHPFDTVKTKMQVEPAYRDCNVRQSFAKIYQTEGIRGFYRGFLPPLMGSMIYRGAAFSAYSGAYAACSQVPFLQNDIPLTGGLKPSVIVGATASAIVRATIESPLDFIKLRYQIGEGVMQDAAKGNTHQRIRDQPLLRSVGHLYHGYTATLFRTLSLLYPFFILIDYSVRYAPDLVNSPLLGPFFKGGICATAAWGFAFPFETAKSEIQADTTGRFKNLRGGTWRVIHELYKQGGIKRLYRGFAPGASRSFVANGASMIIYSWFQDSVR